MKQVSAQGASQKTLKKRLCVACRKPFDQWNSTVKVCGLKCAIEAVTRSATKRLRREKLLGLEKLKTLTDHLSEAQDVFNSFIRERDKDLPCISCNRHHKGQYHAGHFRGRKAAPQLRFNEDNVSKQCKPCNKDLSGNIVEYRKGLIKKIGIERVEALEHNSEAAGWTIEKAKEIKAEYKQKLKDRKEKI